ncbi:hypothetical protein crov110 [Cafeteria roenbergensis virus]|uniref:Uncharacterized protein n=1 Tax=Cafeteria roenbergensis virus (strain BV-PW1) TaxID=693272 RepID=E3T4N0_CROVB|nr:hypothetical protein crov110 [Cafeteria roenbergensis virus BV-PW1]ADO67143.1 hypothetical protein crov110 [Cafeteria roenbergensis virus BV-PW1]
MFNNLINILKNNITWKDLIILFLVVYLLYKINVVEKMSDSTSENIRQTVKDVYQVDVQAIKNLGEVAKTLLDANDTLTLPFKVKITGGLEVDDQIIVNEGTNPDLLMLKHSNKDYLYYNKDGMLGKTNLENSDAINKLNISQVGNINATGDILTTGQNIAIKRDGKYMSRLHHNGADCYMDYMGNLIIRQNNNDGIPGGQAQIKGGDLNCSNIDATGDILTTGQNIAIKRDNKYMSRLHHNGQACYIDYMGDLNMRQNNNDGIPGGQSLIKGGDFNCTNINTTGKIVAGGQVEGATLKSRDVIYTAGGGWFRADNNSNNRVLVNGQQNG